MLSSKLRNYQPTHNEKLTQHKLISLQAFHYASSIRSSEIHRYSHAGHRRLCLPSLLGSPTATARRSRQIDLTLVDIPERAGSRLRHHAQRIFSNDLVCSTTEALSGSRVIQNLSLRRRAALNFETCGCIRKTRTMAPTFIWILILRCAPSWRQTPSCTRTFTTPDWQGKQSYLSEALPILMILPADKAK